MIQQRRRPGPAPSEQALFDLWDRIDQERVRRSEQAAVALAERALAAIVPPVEQTPQNAKDAHHD